MHDPQKAWVATRLGLIFMWCVYDWRSLVLVRYLYIHQTLSIFFKINLKFYIICFFFSFFFTLYLFTSTRCYAFIWAVSPINSYCSMPTVNASAAILPSIKSGLPYLLSNHYHPSHWLCPHFINHFTVSLAIPLGNYSVGTFRCLFQAIYLIASPGKQKQGDDWDR